MADICEADYGTAYYRSRDPIKNFRIRVRLERASSMTAAVPQLVLGERKDAGVELQTVDQTNPTDESEVYEFRWQEKLFSKREVEKYSNEQNCLTVLEHQYHKDVIKLRDHGYRPKRLFSYVNSDSFTNTEETERKFTNLPTEQPTQLARQMATVRHRRGAASRGEKRPTSFVTKTNIVVNEPSEELKKDNRLISSAVQTMYIMADLCPTSRTPTEADEAVLCTLKVDANGVLTIKPDFNKSRRPYKIGGGLLGRELCQYTLEHASKQLDRKEQEREFKMYKEMYARHADFLSALVGQGFEMPPPDVFRLNIFGEIESARNFEYDSLYVHWFIDLPTGWVPNGQQQLSGVTQACCTKTEGRDEVAYFSYPFNFDLLYIGCILNKDEDFLPRWPLLYIEVLSLDSWQRYRTEGYGYLAFPQSPGCMVSRIDCWRPAGNSVIAGLRRVFIGGSPELEDPTYTAVPSAFEGTHLSRYGFTSISTGSVSIKTHTVFQSQAFLHSVASKKKVASVVERIGFSSTQANVMNVLEAFQKAKQRMIAARENLKSDFIKTLGAFAIDDTEA